MLGSEKAPVAILEYSDFECPYCAKFAREVLPILRAKYVDTGKVTKRKHYEPGQAVPV